MMNARPVVFRKGSVHAQKTEVPTYVTSGRSLFKSAKTLSLLAPDPGEALRSVRA